MKVPSEVLFRKVCSKCRVVKRIIEFNFRNTAKDIRHSYCRDCGKELTQSHYKRNKQQYFEKNLRSFKKRREFAREIKNRSCADCGVKYPYYVMDFDHREDEKKEYELNSIEKMSINVLKREIAKCDVVCSNCHRERTYQRRITKERNL
jgi:hypothetical protein